MVGMFLDHEDPMVVKMVCGLWGNMFSSPPVIDKNANGRDVFGESVTYNSAGCREQSEVYFSFHAS